MARDSTLLTPKDVEEIDVITFDFTSMLVSGETIQSVSSMSCSVFAGVDSGASGVLLGAGQIQGTTVLQQIQSGLNGVEYHIRCKIVTSLSRTLVLSGLLQDLLSLGVLPPQGIAVTVSRPLTTADWGKTLDCTAGAITLTVPVGLPVDFECRVIPNGTTSIASDGVALLNGALTTITRLAATPANTMFSIRMRTTQNSFMVTGA
jgi:hypothetical protein